MKPVLLLVPGMLNDEAVWEDVAAELTACAQVRIAQPVQASIAAMAQAAWRQLSDLPEKTPVVIAGFSLGGYVAIEMLTSPQRALHAAALICTSARPETPESAAGREQAVAAMQNNFEATIKGIARRGTHEPSEERLAQITEMMRRVGPEVAIRQMRAIAGRTDHRDALTRLALPVAVLCGSHDRITPATLGEEIAALVTGASCEIVDGTGHMLPMEDPQSVARALRALLQ